MDIITQKEVKTNKLNSIISISSRSDLSEFFGNEFPYPSNYFYNYGTYTYQWFVKGLFLTKESNEYYNDVIGRIYLTLKEYNISNKYHRTLKPTSLELKHFQNLKSLTVSKMIKRNRDNKEDFVFWVLKDYSEEVIRERGIITYDILLEFAYLHFQDFSKGFSTIKSKCRSTVNWYIKNDYRVSEYKRKCSDEEYRMTRQQNMKKVKEKQFQETQLKIKNFISGMFIEEYKKPNGKWNYSKLEKSLRITRQTIKKHIEEIEKEL